LKIGKIKKIEIIEKTEEELLRRRKTNYSKDGIGII